MMQASDVVTVGTPTPDQLWGLEYLFSCDWSNGMSINSAYSTDIVKTLDDREQRWGFTPVPFRTINATLLTYGNSNVAKTRNLIARASAARWLVPLYSDEVIMNANGSSFTVFGDMTNKRFFINQRVALVRFGNSHCEPILLGTALIGNVNSGNLVLDSSTTSWKAGDSIFPLIEADIALSNVVDIETDNVLSFELTAQETFGPSTTPGLVNIGNTGYPNAVTFGGYLVLNPDPDFGKSGLKVGVVRSGIVSQVGLGKVASVYGSRHRWQYTLDYTNLSRQNSADMIRFFESCGGRLKPFWLISPTSDVPVSSFSTTTITCPASFNVDDWAFYTHVAVVLADGSFILKAIVSVARVSSTDTITVASFGIAPTLSNVKRVSFAHLMRLDSDEMKEDWNSDSYVLSSFDCVEVFGESDITLTNLTDLVTICSSAHDPDDPAGVPIIDPPPINPDDPDVFSYVMTADASPLSFEADSFSTINGRIKTGAGVDTGILDGLGISVSATIGGSLVQVSKTGLAGSFHNFVTFNAYEYSTGLHGMNDPVYFDVDESDKHSNILVQLSLASSPTLTANVTIEVLGYLLSLARNVATFDPTIPNPVTLTAKILNEDSSDSAALDGQTIVVTATLNGVAVNIKKTTGGSFVSSLNFTVSNFSGSFHGFSDTVYVNANSGDAGKVVAFTATILDLTQTVSSTVAIPLQLVGLGTSSTSVGMASADSINWVSETIAAIITWSGIAYSPSLDRFVAVGSNGVSGVMTSDDGGHTWTLRTTPSSAWTGVCWSPALSLFVAVSQTTGTAVVMTSSDGITWTIRSMVSNAQYFGVVWAPSLALFIACGITATRHFATSPDGVTWTQHTSSNIATTRIAWGDSIPIAVAVASGVTSGTNDYMTSPDGTTWTLRSTGVSGALLGVCYSDDLSLFCAVGAGGKVLTSTNGTSWTTRTASAANDWQSITWSHSLGLFIALASNGTDRVMTSPDGVTWTPRTAVGTNVWNRVACK